MGQDKVANDDNANVRTTKPITHVRYVEFEEYLQLLDSAVEPTLEGEFRRSGDTVYLYSTGVSRNLSETPDYGAFGDGSDGSVTITSNTTLTRDMYYDSLSMAAGFTLSTDGFRIFCRRLLTMVATSIIERDGIAATDINGAAGIANQTGGLAGSGGGGDGAPGTAQGIGSAGTNITALGGTGGAGGDGTPPPGAGGAGGVATIPNNGRPHTPLWAFGRYTDDDVSRGGAGGGGGGRNTGTGATGGGGGGGGVIMLFARRINNSGTIRANGGNGAAATGTNSGGGGGGAGGFLFLYYLTLTSAGAQEVNGGSGGAGAGADAGATGGVGNIVTVQGPE